MKIHLFDLKEMYSKDSIQLRSAFEEKKNTKTWFSCNFFHSFPTVWVTNRKKQNCIGFPGDGRYTQKETTGNR